MSYTVPKNNFSNIAPTQVPMVLPSVQPSFPTYSLIPTTMCSNPLSSNPTFHSPSNVAVAGPPSRSPAFRPPSVVTLIHQPLPDKFPSSPPPYVINPQPIQQNVRSNPTTYRLPALPNPSHAPIMRSSTPGNVCDLQICSVESLAPATSGGEDPQVKNRKTIRLPRRRSVETEKERQVRRLEKKLAIYHQSIEEAGGAEVGLEDLGDEGNSLERLNRLEKKAAQIWEKICELKGKSDRIMVMSDSFKNVNCTPYPSINHRIERFFMRNILDLPDIIDVSEMISKVNEKEKLCLSKEETSRLSKKVLQFVGNRMSQRRRTDLYEVLRSRTEEGGSPTGKDPYLHDPVFKARLEENEASFKKRLQETMGVFSDKQDKLGLNGEEEPGPEEGEASPCVDHKESNLFCDMGDSPSLSPLPLASCSEHAIPTSSESSNYETPPDFTPSPPPLPSAPFSSVPISSAPISSIPISSAPISSVPISSVPFSSAPFSSVPFSSAPFSSVPFSSAHFSSVPLSSAPFSSIPSVPLSMKFRAQPLKRMKLDRDDVDTIVISSDEELQ